MTHRGPTIRHARSPARHSRLVAVMALSLGWLAGAPAGHAAGITLEARVLAGGHVRVGAWTAVQVTVRNDGPAVTGELRLAGGTQGRSSYGTAVDLPTDSAKVYTLYGQPAVFRQRLEVALVSGGSTLATTQAAITAHDAYQPIIAVIAERPQALVPDLKAAATSTASAGPAVVSLTPADLPARVEAWSAIDRLIWQDVDSAQLDDQQKAALRAWLGSGGRLVVLGGSTGAATLRGFGDLLPYTPDGSIDVSRADLARLLGKLPSGSTALPALTGRLERGSVLARAGERPIAAEHPLGQGAVSLIGFDPGTEWLAGSGSAIGLWRRLLPSRGGPTVNPISTPDDGAVVSTLSTSLPAADLPDIDQLFALLVGYVALIGPLNYLVLRRLDRREWAWLTMPVLVVIFSLASYSLGRLLKGSDVIVNQVAIVRGAAGTETGLGQAYVGVFSPSRQRFDVLVHGGALLSNPVSQAQQQGFEQPLDVLTGETSRLRDFQVGYGTVRAFRAESQVATPRVSADLRYEGGRLVGSIRNESDARLEQAAVIFGGAIVALRTLEAGETRAIDLRVPTGQAFGLPLSERLFGSYAPDVNPADRTAATRREVISMISGYSSRLSGTFGFDDGPLLLAWRPGAVLDVELAGEQPNELGDALFILPLGMTVSGSAYFPDPLIRRTLLAADAGDASFSPDGVNIGRGTLTVEYRAPSFAGAFVPRRLSLALAPGGSAEMAAPSKEVSPLPPAEQPDQDDPVGRADPLAGARPPAIQLFDRIAGRWVEFPPFGAAFSRTTRAESVSIVRPERYVDAAGAFLVRFVGRGEYTGFQMAVRLEGEIE
ncbi:MAG TPA: hypothetical protein VFK38_04500 [Candidatus Limnocylindrales bacterium]|nr:hypothetical protein [Candidatus Limnocylindrales bacterium]